MTMYAYRSMDANGRKIRGSMDAANLPELELRLKRMDLDLIDCKEQAEKTFYVGKGKVARKDLINFCFHMEQMTAAGEQRDHVGILARARIDVAPAESISHTIGIRQRNASSRIRVTLVSPTKPIEPPLTVKSYAAAETCRPETLPQPQITASAGT